MTSPIHFLSVTFPDLFAKGVASLRDKAATSPGAAAKLADVEGARGAIVLEVEGEGIVYLRLASGTMTPSEKPAAEEVTLAVAAPAGVLQMLLGEAAAAGELEEQKAARSAVGTASKKLQDALGADSLTCHVIIEGVPDHGTVTARIGLNVGEPPAQPGFTATLAFSDLEAARSGNVSMQELFMGGKLRMAGDYMRALQLGMQLMQSAAN